MVVAHHRPLHKRAVKTIREGIARGQFRAVDPDQMVFTIFGMIMYYFATGQLASQIWNRDILESLQRRAAPPRRPGFSGARAVSVSCCEKLAGLMACRGAGGTPAPT